jgi:hypothetical protein
VNEEKPKPVKLHREEHQKKPRPQLAAPWKPGESGNPAGRPLGSRNKLSESVIHDIAADWAVGGAETIARVRMTDPATYFRVVASILPKDVLVNVQQTTPGNLDADEWRVLVDLVRLIKSSAPEGSQALPSEIAPAIEETVRAHFAKPIENTTVGNITIMSTVDLHTGGICQ